MDGYTQWAALAEAHQPALIPSLPEQEADAESLPLPGAPDVRAQAGPAQFDPPDPVHAEDQNVSNQIPTGPSIQKGTGDEKHEHYWIHTVTETIERGYYDFEAFSVPLSEDNAYQLFGLDDLRNRATILVVSISDGAEIYFGKRDRIDGSDPSTGFPLVQGSSLDYRSRNEAWIICTGGTAVIGVIEYHGEPTSDTLAEVSGK